MSFPTTSLLDDFDRADGAPGGNWSAIWGDPLFEILSDEAYAHASWHGGYWSAATFGPDSEVYLTQVPAVQTCYLFIRLSTPASPCGYMLWRQSTAGEIHRVDSGVKTLLGASFTLPDGAGYRVGLEVIGSTIKVYLDDGGGWDEMASRSDGTYDSAGYLGWDTPSGTATWDDWSGGTVVTGGADFWLW